MEVMTNLQANLLAQMPISATLFEKKISDHNNIIDNNPSNIQKNYQSEQTTKDFKDILKEEFINSDIQSSTEVNNINSKNENKPLSIPQNSAKTNIFSNNTNTVILQSQITNSENISDINNLAETTKIKRTKSKISLIRDKIKKGYYFQNDISDLIAEKLMNGWT